MFRRVTGAFKEEGLMNELCEHLRQIGINATLLESGSPEAVGGDRRGGMVLGSVKVEGRNINLVQVERIPTQLVYQYRYIVRANVDDFEKQLEAKGEPKKKGFMSKEVVDYEWKGKDLAQRLNGDSDLTNMLLKEGVDKLEVKPDKKHNCVRISPIVTATRVSIGGIPVKGGLTVGRKEFPTPGAFETYDRIAQHIRSIATVRP